MAGRQARPVLYLLFFLTLVALSASKKFDDEEKPSWAKKDIRDYSDADLERLLDQWEVSVVAAVPLCLGTQW